MKHADITIGTKVGKFAVGKGEPLAENTLDRLSRVMRTESSTERAAPAIVAPSIKPSSADRIASVMTSPDKVIDLARRLQAPVRTWQDLSSLDQKANRAVDSLFEPSIRVQTKLSENGFNGHIFNLTTEELTAMKEWPGLKGTRRAIQTVIDGRAKLASAETVLSDELTARASRWTGKINQFARSNGLPSARFRFANIVENEGSYWNGEVEVAKDLVISRSLLPRAVAVGVHEVTHHEQTFIQLSHIADKLGIGVQATDEQLEAVDAEFTRLTPKKTLQWLKFRGGRRLTDDADDRAERLLASCRHLRSLGKYGLDNNKRWYESFAENDIKENIDALFGSEQDAVSAALSADKAGSPAAKMVIDQFASAHARIDKTWSPKYIRKVATAFNAHVERGRMLTDDRLGTWRNAYGAAFHEQEASVNESLALEYILGKAQ